MVQIHFEQVLHFEQVRAGYLIKCSPRTQPTYLLETSLSRDFKVQV